MAADTEPVGSAITSYIIDAYRVSIVDIGGRIEYVVSPFSELGKLYNAVGERLDDLVLLMKKGNDLEDVLSVVLTMS